MTWWLHTIVTDRIKPFHVRVRQYLGKATVFEPFLNQIDFNRSIKPSMSTQIECDLMNLRQLHLQYSY